MTNEMNHPLNKRMCIKEFRELGLLHEVNRLFFHPLGLALALFVYMLLVCYVYLLKLLVSN
jgi:hypothetical protein